MKKIYKYLLLVSLLVFAAGCTSNISESINGNNNIIVKNINLPKQITIYKNGRQLKVLKNNNKYAEILKLTDNRIGTIPEQLRICLPEKSMDELKSTETIIEFVYSKQQENIGHLKNNYTGLIFVLTGRFAGYCFFEQDTNCYAGPIHNLGFNDDLLSLVN